MLTADNLACVRGDRELFSSVKFIVQAGELLHLHGPNGSGKTSLLRMLCGLSTPSEGRVLWNSAAPRALGAEFFESVTYLGHQNALQSELSAIENLQMSAAIAGRRISAGAACNGLEAVGLAGKEDLQVKVLSQGQRRRVALARLILNKTKLWILDEPLAALDATAVTIVEGLLNSHLLNGGMAVLTTHQPIQVAAGVTQHVYLGASAHG